MSQSNADPDKRIDCKATEFYADLPALWASLGRQSQDREGFATFYAQKIFVDDRLVTERESPTRVSYERSVDLWVLYRNPETDETVERHYKGATVETGNSAVAVDYPFDGEYHKIAYPGVRPDEDCGYTIVPKCVFDGEPRNFRASIDVHPDVQRVHGGQ